MESQKSVKITTKKQFEIMIDFMIEHPFIAKGMKYAESSTCKEKYGECWENLPQLLNSLGPPIRKSGAWQKVWMDYKLKLKKKLAHNKKEVKTTGGGSCRLASLSSMEEQVIHLLQLDRALPHNAVVFGINVDHNTDNNREIIEMNSLQQAQQIQNEQQQERQQEQELQEQQQQPEEQHDSAQQTPRNKRRRNEFEEYRKEMLGEQTDSLNKITNLFENCNKYLKRISDAAEKKIQIYEKVQKRKEAEMNLRREIMELEKKKLELELSKL